MNPHDAAVVVIGAGPAGLAAASALAANGVRKVLVIERDDEAGGLPRFCHHPGFGWEYTHRLETGPSLARRLLRALDPDAVTIATRTSALAIGPGPEIEIVGVDCGHARLRPRAVILATGIRERPRSARLVPGRRPERGILTTGQLQQLVARGARIDGRRAIVVGTEHVSFSVLWTARRAGLEVVAMVGPEDRVMSHAGAGWLARVALGIPIHLSSTIEDIGGSERVDSVVLRGPAGPLAISCDTVIFTGDFVPDAALLHGSLIAIDPRTGGPAVDQWGRTGAPGVFAAGNLLRAVESSGRVAIEGARVGANAAAYLRGAPDWIRDAASIRLGDGLAYLVPQLWSPRVDGATALTVSLRAAADFARGRLRLAANGENLWTGPPTAIRRQRRLRMPASAFDRLIAGHAAELLVDAL